MADTKISALTGYTPPIDTDVLPIVDVTAGVTKKITWANIKAALALVFKGVGAIVDKTDNYQVLNTDLGTGVALTMSYASLKTFTLPTSANMSGHTGKEITFVKKGAGKVTIQAPAGVTIADSTSAGSIYNDQASETWASITLVAITTTVWAIKGFDGTWTTT